MCSCVNVLYVHFIAYAKFTVVMSKYNFSYVAHYFMPKIYGCVTDRHCLSTTSVGLTCEHIKWGSLTLAQLPRTKIFALSFTQFSNL